MDLVDIDQVLDNLELRIAADEQLSRNAAATAAAAAAYAGAEVRPLGDGSSSNSAGAGAGASFSNGSVAKNFVGVSQVFDSLDDYRNNVKSLETVAPQNYDWQLPVGDAGRITKNEKVKEDDDAHDHEDLQKFSENPKDQIKSQVEKNSEPIGSSPESLTTSSCSTFSSGPSPSNATNSDELTTPPDTEKLSAFEVPPKIMSIAKPNSEPENPPKKAAVEDLAVGLSSISISNTSESILPCEVTASSALGKVLNELSAETTELNTQSQPQHSKEVTCETSSDIMPVELEQSVVVQSNEVAPQTNEPEECHPAATPKRSQPITFCSTMDDISDTELDSMLQEIDIDEPQEQPTTSATSMAAIKISNEIIEDDECPSISPATEEESVRILSEHETASADQMNIDNFSQASTIEFADLRNHEQSTLVTPMGNDMTSSFSSSESDSLSGRKLDHDDDDDNLATDALDAQRPERPTTLDLNNYSAQMYVNAGQTPPGEQQLDPQQTDPSSDEYNEVEEHNMAAGTAEDDSPLYEAVGYSDPHANLGKVPPIWVPDNMASGCMQCQQKFTMIKRRHHCRACGKVLCSLCCSQRFKLEFAEPESRVCVQCFMILTERQETQHTAGISYADAQEAPAALPPTPLRSPNPNNPMEYCSTIPPHRQVNAASGAPPPSVIVPVGVLKKTDSSSISSNSSGKKGRKRKSVMFSDGIAPGSELAGAMEQQWSDAKQARRSHNTNRNNAPKAPTPGANESRSIDNTTLGLVAQLFRGSIPPSAAAATLSAVQQSSPTPCANQAIETSPRHKLEAPRFSKLPANADPQGCFIPPEEHALPPICLPNREATNCDFEFKEVRNNAELVERLKTETLKFIVKKNFFVLVKIVNLNCCMNRWVINFTTLGLHYVGNDEIIILLEIKLPKTDEPTTEPPVPRDIFQHLYDIYIVAENGRNTVKLTYSSPSTASFLGSREYGGFIYIRPTYQCLQGLILPENPYSVGVLIHRHEVPWAKVLPLRLILRLGAQYRYYPCPLISVRNRESVYAEIGQTFFRFLADFRNFTYTLPTIRGLYIHMEDRQTTVIIPRHRLKHIIRAINIASDHILAFAGNFSKVADGHLVCMQNVNDNSSEMYSYSTQAINIQGQPRKVTGASFFVLNEALKSSSGMTGKCSIVEDGLMVQILPAKMEEVRNALRNQSDIDIVCGPVDSSDEQSEVVTIKWVDNDGDINVGVESPIDKKSMEGVPSIRIRATYNYSNANYTIRLTDIFILKSTDWYATNRGNYSDISRISEQLARSASMALLPFLDLLAAAGISKIGLRVTLDQESVGYEAGARGSKLPPLYMNALDNHLIATLHGESTDITEPIVLELIFYIIDA